MVQFAYPDTLFAKSKKGNNLFSSVAYFFDQGDSPNFPRRSLSSDLDAITNECDDKPSIRTYTVFEHTFVSRLEYAEWELVARE